MDIFLGQLKPCKSASCADLGVLFSVSTVGYSGVYGFLSFHRADGSGSEIGSTRGCQQ